MKRRARPSGPETGSDPLRYATAYHAPVLWKPVVDGLISRPDGVYVDGTLGGGGHTAALLEALAPGGRVVGIDQDPQALRATAERLAAEVAAGRFVPVRGNFGDLRDLLAGLGLDAVDGLLLDLGVSSHQVDEPARGFSYMGAGLLDMRMDTGADVSAHDVVNGYAERELRQLLFDFGEEPRATRVARAIVAARPIETTTALAAAVRSAVPVTDEVKTLARVFQAIRIAVNRELEVLEQVLVAAAAVLRPGGRVAVISYHSLEDRRVKRFFRYGNFAGEPVRDVYGNLITPWRELTRRPIEASADEVARNPRARSARLRLAERAAAEAPGEQAIVP